MSVHSFSSEVTLLDDYDAIENMPANAAATPGFTKAASIEGSKIPTLNKRPKTLPQSLSEPAAVTRVSPAKAQRKPGVDNSRSPGQPGEDSSSPESTDSASLNGDETKKKKKRKLFSKLLKGTMDKHKNT